MGRFVCLLGAILLLVGCGRLDEAVTSTPSATVVETVETVVAEPTVADTADVELTSEPVSELPAVVLPETVAEFDALGVSFFYDTAVTGDISGRMHPAMAGVVGFGVDGPPALYYDVPDFVLMEMATTAVATRPTLMMIQPITNETGEPFAGYDAWAFEQERIEIVQAQIAGEAPPVGMQVSLTETVPFPHQKGVDFSNGRGRRYVGHIAAGPGILTLTNDELYYIYEGVTNDGRYLVYLQFPISNEGLPNAETVDYTAYIAGKNAQDNLFTRELSGLDELAPNEFVPDLRQLDLMMESLFVSPEASVVSSLPSNEPDCVDGAQFVADVTVPDGTPIEPRTVFTKTWRLRNTGTCTWSSAYQLVAKNPSGGAGIIEAKPFSFVGPVPVTPPGGEADVSLSLQSPPIAGYYRAEWQLNAPFDLVNRQDWSFGPSIYTEITVNQNAAAQMPMGEWRVTFVSSNGDAETPYSALVGETVTFGEDFIALGEGRCEGVTYGGRFVMGAEMADYNYLIPEDVADGMSYLELIETTCGLPGTAVFVRRGELPHQTELVLRVEDAFLFLSPK